MASALNLTRRLLAEHLLEGELGPGHELRLRPDQLLLEDATGSMTYLQLETLNVERPAVPLAVLYVDHNILQVDGVNMDEHRFLQSFSARYGIKYSRPGNGISHIVHLERFAVPGELLAGADSHTTMAGALGMFAVGAGGVEVAAACAGHGVWIPCPTVVAVELRGTLPDWVEAKDVVLELLRRHGTSGGYGKVFEFVGEGVATLSVMERGTICNMVLETGATTGVFPSDERTREWLATQDRDDDFTPMTADEGAAYDEHEVIDLSSLEPLIAKPHSPAHVVPVADVEGTPVGQVCVGSSVNSSYEDLARVGSILRSSVVHPGVELSVAPGSRQVLDAAARSGVYRDLVAAGARVLEAVCGPCIGIGGAPSPGVPSVRTFNRNFPGRSGTEGDEVYLCSPSVAAATALRGVITDPRRLGEPPEITPASYDPGIVDAHIFDPPPSGESGDVEIVRGENIVPPPTPRPVPKRLEGRVLIVLGDHVQTGDMAPDGVFGLPLWSNIPECAVHMFRRQDPDFYSRATSWGGGFIVAGDNYGQGSSREQAALVALQLGVRCIAAKSFARIHRQNLIAQGILPLVFARSDDYLEVHEGDGWSLDGVRDAVESGLGSVRCTSDSGRTFDLDMNLQTRERNTLLAGGTLAYIRALDERSSEPA
jgi:aconitate hydratase